MQGMLCATQSERKAEGRSLDWGRISLSVILEKVQGVAMTDRVWLKSEGSNFMKATWSRIKGLLALLKRRSI